MKKKMKGGGKKVVSGEPVAKVKGPKAANRKNKGSYNIGNTLGKK